MLDAVSAVALCAGVRDEDTDRDVKGVEVGEGSSDHRDTRDVFLRLVRKTRRVTAKGDRSADGNTGGYAVVPFEVQQGKATFARLGMVESRFVLWSSGCSRVVVGSEGGEEKEEGGRGRSDVAAPVRRCKACRECVGPTLWRTVREAAAAAAAAAIKNEDSESEDEDKLEEAKVIIAFVLRLQCSYSACLVFFFFLSK